MAASLTGIVSDLNKSMELQLSDTVSMEELQDLLSRHIHQLISGNFNKLISILYRLDVSEKKLRRLLEDNPAGDAGRMIAQLIIERQLQKDRSREEYRSKGENNIDENEKW